MTWPTWLCVALGAAVGAPLRFLVSGWLNGRRPPGAPRSPGAAGAAGEWGLPWGTLLVNTGGSLVLGWSAAQALEGAVSGLVGVGFCGGLTTYSSFAVQTVALGVRRGSAYVALTLVLALGACALGHTLAQP